MSRKNREYEEAPRSNVLLYVLLGILVVVGAFVAWVNVAKPPKVLELRDRMLADLDIQNPFAAPEDMGVVDPDAIPEAIKNADAEACKALDALGAIVIRDSITKMGSVVHLDTKTNSDEAMKLVGKLTYLNALNAVNAEVTDAQTENWVALQRLTSLNVQNNPITSKSLKNIAQMASLDGVYLENTDISSENLEAILALDNVKILNLSGCQLKDADMAIIGQMKSLHWILIENMNLTDACLMSFVDMPNLKTVTIKKGNQITDEGAQKFIKAFREKHGLQVDVN